MPTYLVQDLFTDTNGTQLTAHDPDIDLLGEGWQNHGSTTGNAAGANADIQSNQARFTTDSRGAVIPTGHFFVRVTVDYTFGAGNTKAAVITNAANTRYNFNTCRGRENNNDTNIFTILGNTTTSRASGSYSFAASTTYEFKVERTPEEIEFFIDGVSHISYSGYYDQNNGHDRHGIFRHADGADDARWENFRVESLHESNEVFRDCFDAADGTLLPAHTPDLDASGNGWANAAYPGESLGDGMGINWDVDSDNVEKVARTTVIGRGAMHDAEITDATIHYVYHAHGAGKGAASALVRWDSSGEDDGFEFVHNIGGNFIIREWNSGSSTNRASTTWGLAGSATQIVASAIGDVYTFSSPQVPTTLTYTDADNLFGSNTNFGFMVRPGEAGRSDWDNEYWDGFQILNETVVSGISVPVARHHYDKNIGAR